MRQLVNAFAVASLLACGSGPRITPRPSVEFEKGLQLFPTARDYDGPGTIFRIDREGARGTAVDLSGMLSLTPRTEVVPTLSLKDRFTARMLGKYLTDSAYLCDSTRDSIVVSATGTRRERATDVQLEAVIDSALKLIRWREDNTYYIITETILADSLNYVFDSHSVADLGGDARLGALARGNARLSWQRDGVNYSLAARFEKPLRVFYKTERLTPQGAALGGGVLAVKRDSVFQRIHWKEERAR